MCIEDSEAGLNGGSGRGSGVRARGRTVRNASSAQTAPAGVGGRAWRVMAKECSGGGRNQRTEGHGRIRLELNPADSLEIR